MGRTIAIANQKGGVGKTTTAINLSACLAEAGQRVLTIDFDPQGNATTGLGLEKEQIEDTVYELLLGDCTLEDCLMRDVQENLDVLPSDSNLAGAEIELLDVENKESVLNGYLETIRDQYDFIIIDCPPSLSLLTINALVAADTVLVPIQCEYYALEGVASLMNTISRVKKTIKLAVCYAEGIMLIGFCIFQFFPDKVLGIFAASDAMLAIGIPAMRIICLHFLLAGVSIVLSSVFQALGNGVFSLIVSVCRQLFVLLPAAWLLAQTGSVNNVWWAFLIAEVVSILMSLAFYARINKTTIAPLYH